MRQIKWQHFAFFCISIFNHWISCIKKQNIPQDAAWRALQVLKNNLFYIWNKKNEISLRLEKKYFCGAAKIGRRGFCFFFENRKYTIKISSTLSIVDLFTLHQRPKQTEFFQLEFGSVRPNFRNVGSGSVRVRFRPTKNN